MRKLPTLQGQKFPDGKAGNVSTINFMRKTARSRAGSPLVRELALSILRFYNVPSSHYASEALAIGDYVKNSVRYVRDPSGIEYLQDPTMLIEQLKTANGAQGDCDDMACLIAALLLSIGHEPFFRAARYNNGTDNYNHIYVVDYEKNKGSQVQRIVLDAIVKDKPIGYEVPQASGDEYPV